MENDRKASLKGTRTSNSFAGNTTFFRRDFGTDFKNADVVVRGLPYDLGVSNRPGARFGPRSIREASCQLAWGEIWPWGFDPFNRIAVMDAGDIEYIYGDSADFFTIATEQTERISIAGAIPFSLGGDHSVTAASLLGISDTGGPVALLHFDAHSDTTDGHEHQHGTMFRFAVHRSFVDTGKSIQIGLRTPYDDSLGYECISAVEAMQRPPTQIAEQIASRVGISPCYITIDIDCLDPSQAPGTGTPIPGGMTILQLLEIIRSLKNSALNIVGFDLVEVAPDYDHAQITSLAAAQICIESLCLICQTKFRY